MMFRNSVRLLFSNFSTVWKILLYKIIVITVVLGIATIVAMPIVEVLDNNNFFATAKESLSSFMLNLDIYSIIGSFNTIITLFINIIADNFNQLLSSLIGVFLVIIVLGGYLSGLSQLAISESLNGYMSSNAQYGFTSSFIRILPKSAKLQFAKIFVNLPINLLITYLIYITLSLLNSSNELIALFAPLLIMTLSTLLISLNLTLFSGVIPAIVIHDASILEGYMRGFKAVSRRFLKTLSNSIVIVLSVFMINIFILVITGGAGLLITLPSSTFLFAIFGMVMYYGSMGMRYYIDPETILTPKKLEEQDKINNAKFII